MSFGAPPSVLAGAHIRFAGGSGDREPAALGLAKADVDPGGERARAWRVRRNLLYRHDASCPRARLRAVAASRALATRLVRLVRPADELRKLRERIVAEHLTQLRIGILDLVGRRVLRERPVGGPL